MRMEVLLLFPFFSYCNICYTYFVSGGFSGYFCKAKVWLGLCALRRARRFRRFTPSFMKQKYLWHSRKNVIAYYTNQSLLAEPLLVILTCD